MNEGFQKAAGAVLKGSPSATAENGAGSCPLLREGKGGRYFIIATAGHVDHGKSALVKALTGIDPTRLPEEKARGITIELGFANLRLPLGGSDTNGIEVGIVDVPGHQDFIRHMVAGVGSIDLALLIVAADDGWMPQTEEHLQILGYLGVTKAIVALTKADLIPREERAVISELRQQLAASAFADAPIVPTSTVTGRGVRELKDAIQAILAALPPRRNFGKPRLPIDRVFTLRGIGTVVTGTLTGGTLTRGQAAMIEPTHLPARIRTLQTHRRETDSAQPGMRVAINLPDLMPESGAAGEAEHTVKRGDVVVFPEAGAASGVWDVSVERSPRLAAAHSRVCPLRHGSRLRVHLGTAAFSGRLILAGRPELNPGERAFAQLRLDTPRLAFRGDRFVLRDAAGQMTLGGGIVLDPDGNRKCFRTSTRQEFLAAQLAAGDDVRAAVEATVHRDSIYRRSGLLLKSSFSREEISEALQQLAGVGKVVLRGDFVIAREKWDALCVRVGRAIERYHRDRPEQPGFPISQVPALIAQDGFTDQLSESIVAALTGDGFIRDTTTIRSRSHTPALPTHLSAAAAKIRAALSAKPLDPPSRKELAPDAARQEALRFLLQKGEAVELNFELVLSAEAFTRARKLICDFLQTHKSATVSELKQAVGASRRIMVPLLEKLDRAGATRRVGDQRTLK